MFKRLRRVAFSRHHLEVLVTVIVSPVQGKVGGFEELFIGVLPRDIQLIKARFCELFDKHAVPGNHLFLGETRVENKGIVLWVEVKRDQSRAQGMVSLQETTYPVSSQHTTGGVHANSSHDTRLSPQETVIQEGDFGQKLAQRPRLDVVIICFAYLPHPAVW